MPLTTPHGIADLGSTASRRRPAGFSLTELLVASAIALVVMGAVAQLFSVFSGALSGSQTTVDLAARMRATAWQVRQDLAGATVDLVPWTAPEANAGYFELIEGTQRDTTLTLSGASPTTNLEGDTDDILLFTTRSAGNPFVGRFGSDKVESACAEVIWFCREAGDQPVSGTKMYNLYRRQLLVVGYVGRAPFSAGNANSTAGTLPNTTYDISMRNDGGVLVPNSLGDLTKRENRFMHGATFPYAFQTDVLYRPLATATFDNTTRVWEDVLLTNVVAFDVRVFDPSAKADTSATPPRYPGDPGYNATTAASGTGALGAFVDLGWGGGTPTAIGSTFPPTGQTVFQSMGMRVANAPRSSVTTPLAIYDTWSLHYEFNGEDDDGDGMIDEGTNAADDNADQLPDNAAEYETSPPYPVPLRGIEVRLRCYEPSAKQVRQVTVRHTFVRK